jgi:hypothetical protein
MPKLWEHILAEGDWNKQEAQSIAYRMEWQRMSRGRAEAAEWIETGGKLRGVDGRITPVAPLPDLTGFWIGETQGKYTRVHEWLLTQRGERLFIQTRWAGERGRVNYTGRVLADQRAIRLESAGYIARTTGHIFVIPQWVGKYVAGRVVYTYTALFRRSNPDEVAW